MQPCPSRSTAPAAAGLAAAARKAAEELGGLESARRAELRLTELDGQRRGLDREERADDELLQDAASWLDGWDSTRAALQEAVESAQEAATRAEHLAGQLEPAQQKSEAARRRDRLSGEAADARTGTVRAREEAAAAHEHWLGLKEQRLNGIAAELAAQLVPGERCAVCGSTEHPDPMRKTAEHVGRDAEETALAAYRRADDARTAQESRLRRGARVPRRRDGRRRRDIRAGTRRRGRGVARPTRRSARPRLRTARRT